MSDTNASPRGDLAGAEGVDALDYDTPQGRQRQWVIEIQEAEKWAAMWCDRARKVIRRYRDERENAQYSGQDRRRLNILWSNVQVLQPALYARRPKPVVERRFRDGDPIGKAAAEVLERAVTFATDNDEFDELMKQVRDDRLLAGRGTAWVRYVPHFVQQQPPTPADGVGITDDAAEYEAEGAQPEAQEVLGFEEVALDYVPWADFLHSPARTWREVRWVARKVQMTRAELIERFGEEIGAQVPLDARAAPSDGTADSSERRMRDNISARATVYEIWDKADRKVCWISKGHEAGPLDERDDPLRLRDFFPCPRPLYATLTTDTLIPVPDYCLYQDQASDLDDVTQRLSRLTEACRVIGVYDAEQDESLGRIFQEGGDNRLIPVSTWASFSEKSGLKGAMDFVPLDNIIATIAQLTERANALKAEIYEITGISDIVRGYSAPSETATAQQIKGQFAALRLGDQQAEVARFARDLIALTAEVISEHFQPQTIALMAGVAEAGPEMQQAFMPAMELLRQDAMRNFRVEIETDSTIAVDEQADKEAANEFLAAMGGYLANALPLAQQAPELLPMIGQAALYLSRRYRAGRQLEGSIEQGFAALQQRAQQMMANPQPDPAMAKAEAEVKAIEAKTGAEIEAMQAKTQASLQTQAMKTQAQMAMAAQRQMIQPQGVA